MNSSYFLQKLYNRYYPKSAERHLKHVKLDEQLQNLSDEEKAKLASKIFIDAEARIEVNDPEAFHLFELALKLDPNNPEYWFKQGKSFLKHFFNRNKVNVLLLAFKSLKIACEIDSSQFEYWYEWAKCCLHLADKKKDFNHLESAKEKFLTAQHLSDENPVLQLTTFYWDFALLFVKLAEESGEAIDLKKAIESFQKALTYNSQPPLRFWFDFAQSYFQMGLLINDNRMYFQAIEYFKKTLGSEKNPIESWYSLAQCFTQLYINTMNESHFLSSDRCYDQAFALEPDNPEILLEWAQLLGESGKWNKDPKRLRLAVEKCQKGSMISLDDPLITAQWAESLSLLGAYVNRLDYINEAECKVIHLIEELGFSFSEAWYAHGICLNAYAIYYNDLEYDELAIEKFQNGVKLDPANEELWHALSKTYCKIGSELEDIDSLEKSVKYFAKAVSLKPACPSIHYDFAQTLNKLFQLSEEKEYLENAIQQYELTLKTQDDAIMQHPEWLFNYAKALNQLGHSCDEEEKYYSKALEIFHQVLLIDPDFPKIHLNIALTFSHLAELTQETKFFERSNNFFQMAIKQDNEDEEAWLEWGVTLLSYGEHSFEDVERQRILQEAENKLTRAGQLGNLDAFYHLACFYSMKRDVDKALFFLQKAAENNCLPPSEEIEEDEWLDNLHGLPEFKSFIQECAKLEENISDEM